MSDFRDSIKVNVDEKKAKDNLTRAEFKNLLSFMLGSMLHEDWKKADEVAYSVAKPEKKARDWEMDENGVLHKFKSVNGQIDGKDFEDKNFEFEEGNPAYRAEDRKVDIRALTFDKLPVVWQKENADAGKVVIDLLYDKIMSGEKLDIEQLSSEVHDAWLSRENNAWAKGSDVDCAYEELPEEEKAKDRDQILAGLDIMERVKSGEITIESVRQQYGDAKRNFDSQIIAIEEAQK